MIRAYFKIKILEVDNDNFFLVAYADNLNQITELWPEAVDIESTKVDKITFTSRFPKPGWFHESDKTNNK